MIFSRHEMKFFTRKILSFMSNSIFFVGKMMAMGFLAGAFWTDVPQVGTIRSIFIQKNADFGNYSPNYDVTLA